MFGLLGGKPEPTADQDQEVDRHTGMLLQVDEEFRPCEHHQFAALARDGSCRPGHSIKQPELSEGLPGAKLGHDLGMPLAVGHINRHQAGLDDIQAATRGALLENALAFPVAPDNQALGQRFQLSGRKIGKQRNVVKKLQLVRHRRRSPVCSMCLSHSIAHFRRGRTSRDRVSVVSPGHEVSQRRHQSRMVFGKHHQGGRNEHGR